MPEPKAGFAIPCPNCREHSVVQVMIRQVEVPVRFEMPESTPTQYDLLKVLEVDMPPESDLEEDWESDHFTCPGCGDTWNSRTALARALVMKSVAIDKTL